MLVTSHIKQNCIMQSIINFPSHVLLPLFSSPPRLSLFAVHTASDRKQVLWDVVTPFRLSCSVCLSCWFLCWTTVQWNSILKLGVPFLHPDIFPLWCRYQCSLSLIQFSFHHLYCCVKWFIYGWDCIPSYLYHIIATVVIPIAILWQRDQSL